MGDPYQGRNAPDNIAPQLSGCLITEEGCASLASALKLQPLPSERAGPELQSSRRLRSEAAVCWTGLDWRLDTLRYEQACCSHRQSVCHTFILGHLTMKHQADPEVEPAGVRWLTPGLRKYSCELTVDTNTVNRKIKLSDSNRKMTRVKEDQSYPDHPERFDYWCPQLLCETGLTGRCYWEVEWSGSVDVSLLLDREALQREVKAAQHISRTELPHPWRTSTPSGVGGRPPGSSQTSVTEPQTALSAAVWPTNQGSFILQTIRILNSVHSTITF
ncbi:hypothetical protein L3Q82_010001 [Scortum barcoo]|uniref:Uncharacterized protein n=1 Tax=Scortum barcoo TaxID=214431 RepID=A0ACB8WE87_9TELE|nr:hypothetical protein L3Q82_010001 [Scortum barcoo]